MLVCSPFVTRDGLDLVQDSLHRGVRDIEVWTRLDVRDWLNGASDPAALRQFFQRTGRRASVRLWTSNALHAKFIIADRGRALAGSANLTWGGLTGNIEIVRRLPTREVQQLLNYVEETRGLLTPTSLAELDQFVARCRSREAEREALLELVESVVPPAPPGRQPLIPLQGLLFEARKHKGKPAQDVVDIVTNVPLRGHQRSGHIKQAYFAAQRFLQEYPQHLPFAASLPVDEPFDLRKTEIEPDWRDFLRRFDGESDADYGYNLNTLIHTYLTPRFGGTTERAGGAGDYPFKIVWPFVGRLMTSA